MSRENKLPITLALTYSYIPKPSASIIFAVPFIPVNAVQTCNSSALKTYQKTNKSLTLHLKDASPGTWGWN